MTGVAINTSKTQIICFRNKSKRKANVEFKFGGNMIEVVVKYKYLGLFLTEHLDYSHMAEVLTGAVL